MYTLLASCLATRILAAAIQRLTHVFCTQVGQIQVLLFWTFSKMLDFRGKSLAIVMFGFSLLGTESMSAEESSFAVLSYNIRYLNDSDGQDVWANRKTEVIETILKADVVGLQEVVDQQLEDIRSSTTGMDWYGVGRDDGARGGESVPIGWKTSLFDVTEKGTFWLSETPEKVGSQGWDAALPRVASWVRLTSKDSESEILVLNTHFDHRGPQARLQSAALIRRWLSEHQQNGQPVLMMGDLNSRRQSPPLDVLLNGAQQDGTILTTPADGISAGIKLRDARSISAISDPGPNSTWNGFRNIVDGQRIDFILVSGAIQVSRFETLDPKTATGRFASDHLPIRAEIRPVPLP